MAGTLFNGKIGSLVNVNDVASLGSVVQRASNTSFYVFFNGATLGGTVLIEGSHDPTFTGLWAPIGTINWTVANSSKNFNVVGNHIALRARLSVALGGGLADIYAVVTQ